MPELDFQISGVESASNGLTPLLQFKLAVANQGAEPIHAVLLHTQIQLQAPQRSYNAAEKTRLVELFGTPDRWGQTLRNRLWTTTNATIGSFPVSTTAKLSVPCTYDLNFAASKYFYALQEGNVPLLFLFSGTVFYEAADGRLQAQPISWNKEAVFQMPLEVWQGMMNEHFPNAAWIYLRREVFDRLNAFKREQSFASWEETIDRLLSETESKPVEVVE